MPEPTDDDDMPAEYPAEMWRNGTVGKYVAAYHASPLTRRLDPEVADVFPDSESVNEALRTLIRIGPTLKLPAPTD